MGIKQELLDTFNGERLKDEYEIQQSRHVLAGNCVWLFWGLIILLNLSIWPKIFLHQNFIVEAFGIVLFLGMAMTIEIRLYKYRVNQTEVDDQQSYAQMIKQLRRGAVKFGSVMFIVMVLVNGVLSFALASDKSVIEFIVVNVSVVMGTALLSGFAIYFIGKRKIERTYKDK
ncbi:hypothetical protein [Staphylococcus americanisciuri]|uniref:DUF3278 domain-containing protein n=1 Tax=Staphylococcus americanisciuri TaxID=2973940 RepID=A0ABT2F2I7_9STAP|nr:hypothetical protein [Staphylococcus americanisciuri]MCS4486075.1 hypothetical protein [Staphylococcus americanisciuri]